MMLYRTSSNYEPASFLLQPLENTIPLHLPTLFPYTSHYSSKSICKYDTCSTVNRVSIYKEKQWN